MTQIDVTQYTYTLLNTYVEYQLSRLRVLDHHETSLFKQLKLDNLILHVLMLPYPYLPLSMHSSGVCIHYACVLVGG